MACREEAWQTTVAEGTASTVPESSRSNSYSVTVNRTCWPPTVTRLFLWSIAKSATMKVAGRLLLRNAARTRAVSSGDENGLTM